jgi:hypothetical protein
MLAYSALSKLIGYHRATLRYSIGLDPPRCYHALYLFSTVVQAHAIAAPGSSDGLKFMVSEERVTTYGADQVRGTADAAMGGTARARRIQGHLWGRHERSRHD